MGISGWGTLVGKIAEWFPSREESRRNRITQIKKEMDEITKSKSATTDSANRYSKLSAELSKLESQASNN